MFSMLCDVESSFRGFFAQVAGALGFVGLLAVVLAVEVFFVLLFVLRTIYSYEMRLGRSLNKLNMWLFKNKKIDQSNIKQFNDLIKKGPKRLSYHWQQFILFREQGPTYYLSLENLVEKPLKTSGWANNIRNLYLATGLWAGVSLLFGIALEAGNIGAITFSYLSVAVALPVFVAIIGVFAGILLRGKKISNLDEIYHNYHIFARFITNACVDLPNFVDYDLLFTSKELEKASPQLREYYESRARQAKKEFEEAKKNDVQYVEYNFEDAGVDGSLVLERAMRETEAFINKKTSILAKIAQVEAEKDALRRNYENVQKDLQRKLQASKENIQKLLETQEATTNRMEVGFLRKQQEQEIAKQESLQAEYDQEEIRFATTSEELDQEMKSLREQLEDSKENVQKAMVAEYQTFYEKVMKSAYSQAEKKVQQEKADIKKERDIKEKELTIVQTQNKRLSDENETLRSRLGDFESQPSEPQAQTTDGHYDENGNYIYSDGSYHDPEGYFHDVDGNVYDINGTLIDNPVERQKQEEAEETIDDKTAFGSYVNTDEISSEPAEEVKEPTEPAPAEQNGVPPMEYWAGEKTEQTEAPAKEETPVEEPQAEETAEQKARAKRGRPRKRVNPEEPKATEPKKRGRPKKEEEEPKAKKPVGRPKKESTAKTSAKKTTKAPAAKKEAALKDDSSAETLNSLEKINEMINNEEAKLAKMKLLISSEIDNAINSNSAAIDKQRNKIMKEIEGLQVQAQQVKEESNSDELASINKRLEDLISAITDLNNK